MPFAAHISAINLTMQNIEQKTNTVRIATLDSLELVELLKSPEFKRKGIKISPYTTSIQLTLHEAFGTSKKVKKKGAVSPEGKGSEFYLKPVDVVIMNPPFSDREKMPPEMREKLKKNPLGEICGHQVNLWGYFLALADLLLKPGGKIGAVIPINIARGKATEKIRKFLLENYHIKYIVKPVGDIAFSEGAAFRDVLLIAEKRKPKKNDVTRIILLKCSIRKIEENEITEIMESIRSSKELFDKLEIIETEQENLKKNFMEYLWSHSKKTYEILSQFYELYKERVSKIKKEFPIEKVMEGFHTSPGGISQILYITDPLNEERIRRSLLIYETEDERYIYFKIKNLNKSYKLRKDCVVKGLKSISGVKKINGENINDYLIIRDFPKMKEIITLSSFKHKLNWEKINNEKEKKSTFVTIFRRFSPHSKNTCILSLYSDEPFVPTDAFKIFKGDEEESKFLCIYLNSVISLVKLLFNMQQTTGQFSDIKEEDLRNFEFVDIRKFAKSEKQTLLNLFEKLKDVEFPSILEQLENRFWARVELDKTILKILGFSDREINEWLPKVYDALVEELKAMKNVR